MLRAQNNQIISRNRKAEKPLIPTSQLVLKIHPENYERLINSISQVRILTRATLLVTFIFIPFISQYCEITGLSNITSYYAKSYLGVFFKKISNPFNFDLPVIAICCVWIAIKFCESRSVSEIFTIQVISSALGGEISNDVIKATELDLLQMLQFKLNFTIPNHYMIPFFQGFPWFAGAKQIVPKLIDLALTIPQLTNQSAQDIFYGCFLACLKIKSRILNEVQERVLSAFIYNRQNSQKISLFVEEIYRQIERDLQVNPMTEEELKEGNAIVIQKIEQKSQMVGEINLVNDEQKMVDNISQMLEEI